MTPDDLRARITDQFSYRDERADVWRAFDLFLETDRFLNLGYSPWYQSHLLGSSQRRLVEHVGSILAPCLPPTGETTLLDVGCGRGGPAVHLADRFGARVVGVDLVPYNVQRAREHAADVDGVTEHTTNDASFVVGDAANLPIRSRSVTASTAIDSIAYLPEKEPVFAELSRVLRPDGVVVLSDLVVATSATPEERSIVDAFAEAWDMPPLPTLAEYERALDDGGLAVRTISDVTQNSVGRFRKWTTLYRRVTGGPGNRLLEPFLRRCGLDPTVIDEQVSRAHDALPSLRHVIVVAESP